MDESLFPVAVQLAAEEGMSGVVENTQISRCPARRKR
jgi:hypothetical protein